MANINFYLSDGKAKTKTTIIAVITFSGHRLNISTRIRISPENWDLQRRVPRKGCTMKRSIEGRLNKFKDVILKCYDAYNTDRISIEDFKILVSEKMGWSSTSTSFFDVFDQFRKSNIKWRSGTRKGYLSLLNHLNGFEKWRKRTLSLAEINLEFVNSFALYLDSHPNDGRDRMQLATVNRRIKQLFSFLNYADGKSLLKSKTWKKYDFACPDPELIALTRQELDELAGLDLSEEKRLEKVRDFFLLQCYTGQRYSDISRLDRTNIIASRLVISHTKTQHVVRIPITTDIRQIIDKYIDQAPFIRISNQKLNDYLKEIGQLCPALCQPFTRSVMYLAGPVEQQYRRWEFLSSHVARATFVTQSILRGMPHKVVMKLTGIRKQSTFDRYLRLVDEDIEMAMLRAWDTQRKGLKAIK